MNWAGIGVAAGVVLLAGVLAIAALVRLRRRPSLLVGLLAGAAVSVAVVIPWSVMAALTIGPAGPLDLTRSDSAGSYARLAAGPTGNAVEFAAVVIGICVACCLLAGWRSRPAGSADRWPEAAAWPWLEAAGPWPPGHDGCPVQDGARGASYRAAVGFSPAGRNRAQLTAAAAAGMSGAEAGRLARQCQYAGKRLAGLGHQMTWAPAGMRPPSCTGTCCQCEGAVTLTLNGPGAADVGSVFPGVGNGSPARCCGGQGGRRDPGTARSARRDRARAGERR